MLTPITQKEISPVAPSASTLAANNEDVLDAIIHLENYLVDYRQVLGSAQPGAPQDAGAETRPQPEKISPEAATPGSETQPQSDTRPEAATLQEGPAANTLVVCRRSRSATPARFLKIWPLLEQNHP